MFSNYAPSLPVGSSRVGVEAFSSMAGIATGCPFKLVHSRKTPPLLPISSFDSKLFGLRLANSNLIKPSSLVSAPSVVGSTTITSRYGGGSRYSGPDRRSRQSDSDEEALDMSSIRLIILSSVILFIN